MIRSAARPLSYPGLPRRLTPRRPERALPPVLAWAHTPGLPFTLVLLALALPAVVSAFPLSGDIWWVLKNGEALLARGELGTSDPFTFAPHVAGAMNVQWLAQLAYYGAYRLLGLGGVVVLNTLVTGATFALVFDLARRRSRNLMAAALATSVAELVVLWQLGPRAQTLAFLFFAATAWLLGRGPRGLPTIIGLACVEAAWANVHGSFFLAPALTSLLLAGSALGAARTAGWRRLLVAAHVRFLLLALGVQVLASLATPYGLALYAYVGRLTSFSIIRAYATEWVPTNVAQAPGVCFFFSLVLTSIVVSRARRGVTAADLVVLGVFGGLAFQAVRNVAWWGLASGPVLAVALADSPIPGWMAALSKGVTSPRQNLLRAGVVALALVAMSPWLKAANPLLPPSFRAMVPVDYPRAAADFLLTQSLPPRVFAHQPWGNYLDWQLWPRYQVMVDASMETHPAEVWLDVLAINAGHSSWQEKLDTYSVDVLLLSKAEQATLVDVVERSPRWRLAYGDDLAVIYIPTDQSSRGSPSM